MADFNVLPWRERRQRACQQQVMAGVMVACVLAAGVIFGVEAWLAQRVEAQRAQSVAWEAQSAAQMPALQQLQKQRIEQQQVAAQWQTMQTLIQRQAVQIAFLQRLATHLPPELSLTLVQQEDNIRWWIEGTTPTAAALTAWMQTLSESAPGAPRVHLEGLRAETTALARQHFRLSVQHEMLGAPAP